MRPMIDAHLDLAWNALYFNRDMLASVAEVRQSERGLTDELARGRNTVTFAELRRARVAIYVATVMGRSGPDSPQLFPVKRTDLDYRNQTIAYVHAKGHLRFITTRGQLRTHWEAW